MSTIDKLFEEAARLPIADRFALVHRLLLVDEPEPSDEVDRAWELEIRERIQRYERGESKSRPAKEVLDELRRRLES